MAINGYVDEGPTGLERLARLLAVTKENATAEISKLTSQNRALEVERRTLETALEGCQDELGDAKSLVDQLRLENTRKWRVEERDDWRALVDSMQTDRKTLQEENFRLKAELVRCITILRTIVPSEEAEVEEERGSGDPKRSGNLGLQAPTDDTPELTHRSTTATVTAVGPHGHRSASVETAWLDALAEEFDVKDVDGGEGVEEAGTGTGSGVVYKGDGVSGDDHRGGGTVDYAKNRPELDNTNRGMEIAKAALEAQVSKQEDELRSLRADVVRLKNRSGPRLDGEEQPAPKFTQSDSSDRRSPSSEGMFRWWGRDMRSSNSSNGAKRAGAAEFRGGVTVV